MQQVGPVLHILDGQTNRQRLTVLPRQTLGIVAGINLRRAHLGLDPGEVGLVDPVLHEPGNHPVQRSFGIGQRFARHRHHDQGEPVLVQRHAIVTGRGIDRALAVELQRPRQHRGGRIAAQQRRQQRNRRRLALIAGVAFGCQIGPDHIGLRHPLIGQNQTAFGQLRRLGRADARPDRVRRRDQAIVFLGQSQHIVRFHIARHHHNRVVRGIIGVVEIQGILPRKLLDLVAPADDRNAIGTVQVLRRRHLFGQQGTGVAVGPLVALFQDDLAFGRHILLGQVQIAHPVGFHLHHQTQPVGGDPLEIGGVVQRGKGIVRPALRRDQFGKLARCNIFGALKHQMLQKMRDAGMARRLVRRPDPVPDHMHHDRGPVILDHHDIHAICQLEAADGVGQHRPREKRQSHAKSHASQHRSPPESQAASYATAGAVQPPATRL